MKKYLYNLIVLAFVAFAYDADAQSSVNSGGDAYETNEAKVTVTIGEPAVGVVKDNDASADIGFQQSYESESVSIEETVSKLQLSVYPNPTSDKITVKNENLDQLDYTFFQLDGKSISSGSTSEQLIELSLSDQSAGVYFIKFTDTENNLIKTFKIIKK
ncbi:MAG: T9SS type A sorting domain-containing protein [Bacteroidia bacterium]|nr:T9SS type A sorting domain-containing protein [Bacteroidia bacterium]